MRWAVRSILYSFGGSEQDEHRKLILDSKNTLEAAKFVKALFTEAMTPEVLAWDASSNNRAMLAGKVSLIVNGISIVRSAEKDRMPISEKIWMGRVPKGPVRGIGQQQALNVYVI